MTNEKHTHRLTGCAPIPLAHYLKALGVLRLVAEQADSAALGWWSGDVFNLRTKLNQESLVQFFLRAYKPTPIVVPWSGSDFFAANRSPNLAKYKERWPESAQRYCPTASTVIEAFMVSDTARLENYREMIRGVFRAMDASGTREKKDIEAAKGEKQKRCFLTCLRSILPDDLVLWLDAAAVLGTEEFAFNALVGSGGGSDGNSHFSDTFMQSLWICLDDFDVQRNGSIRASNASFSSDSAIRAALFADQSSQAVISGRSPGLFSSQDVGGPNATAGFDGEASFNPWNYILLLEGCLAFSGSLAKRVGSSVSPEASFPFLMRLCNAGSGTLIGKETSGREVWLPIWRAPVSYNELGVFFSEGRLTLGQRYARNGLDAARAVASFGYDRGIDCFQRVGIVRGRVGGDNYNTAISLGSWSASPNAEADLVTDFDPWLDSFRCAASADLAPSRAQRVLRRLESAIFDLCQQKGAAQLQSVLCALGEAEAVLARSAKWRTEAFQRPVPLLSPKWLKVGDDGTTEFRLAASLTGIFNASIGGFREHLEPVEIKGRLAEGRQQWVEWSDDPSSANNIVWSEADLENNLIAVLQRRCMEAIRCGARTIDGTQVFPGESRCYATLDDVSAFLRYEVDDERIAILVRGLSLLDWEKAYQEGACNLRHHGQEDSMPDATFALLKLCHSPHPIRESYVPLNATIARLAAAGRLGDATQLAARRLLGSSLPPAIRVSSRRGLSARRITAALLFPLTWADTKKLADRVLKSQMESV